MKKYAISALLINVYLSLSFVSAQTVGDVAPDNTSSGCTALSYNLTYKKSKDANTNGEVSDLQYFLQDQGFLRVDPNGLFGPSTLRAVQAFQKRYGFISSGYVGPVTRTKIKEISCNQGASTTASTATVSGTVSVPGVSSVYGNVLAKTSISEPKWSAPVDGKGFVSISLSNVPSTEDIAAYSFYIKCEGVSLPRNGGDLCNTSEKIRNLNMSNFSYDFPYTLTGVRGSGILASLSALNGSGKVIGTLTKITYVPTSYLATVLVPRPVTETLRQCPDGHIVSGATQCSQIIPATPVIKEAHGPNYNAMSCSKSSLSGLANGQTACYGIWDYGNEFGGDPDMCPPFGYSASKTGCSVKTTACVSGVAIATKVVTPTSMSVSSSEVVTYARNLKSTPEAVAQQIPTLWEYTCSGSDTNSSQGVSQPVQSSPSAVQSVLPKPPTNLIMPQVTMLDNTFALSASVSPKVAKNFCWTNNSMNVKSLVLRLWSKVPSGDVEIFTQKIPLGGFSRELCAGVSFALDGRQLYFTLDAVNEAGSVRSEPSNTVLAEIDFSSDKILLDVPKETQMDTVARTAYLGWKVSQADYCEVYKGSTPGGVPLMRYDYTNKIISSDGGYTIDRLESGQSSYAVSCVSTKTGEKVSKVTTINNIMSFANGDGQVLGAFTDNASCTELPINLHRGMETSSVSKLQKFLLSVHTLELKDATGFYGDNTIDAVKVYQTSKNIPVTGMVYEATRKAIAADTCSGF
jgi:peptidoglycan hydrolase-like protein with peptidoglycan-binding domain